MTNTGAATATAVAMLLKFENGTVFDLNGTSSPRFQAAVLPAGDEAGVQSMVPAGACSPDGTSCLDAYLTIVDGRTPGRAVGLVTSLGNTFWYVPSAAPGGAQDPTLMRTVSTESTSATNYTLIPGLSFGGAAGAFYQVEVRVGFWQSGPSPNADMFSIGVTNGTTFMFCGGTDWSVPTGSTGVQPPGIACTSLPGQSLGPTWTAADYCLNRDLSCEFVGTAYVYFGPAGGTFSLEFRGTPSGDANVLADSTLTATES